MSKNIVKDSALRSDRVFSTLRKRKAISQCLGEQEQKKTQQNTKNTKQQQQKKPKNSPPNPLSAGAVNEKKLKCWIIAGNPKNIPQKEISNSVSDQYRHRICNFVFAKCQELQKKQSNTKPRLAKLAFRQNPWDVAMYRTQTMCECMMIHHHRLKLML